MMSSEKLLSAEMSLAALKALDFELKEPLHLVLGGGGALVLAYKFPLATEDLDAFSRERNLPSVTPLIEKVAEKMGLPLDWLNPFFSTFTHILPQDYGQRLRTVFSGNFLKVEALGPEDLFLMKCFAGRDKDIAHAKKLLQIEGFDLGIAEDRIAELIEKRVSGSEKARDFLDDVTEGF